MQLPILTSSLIFAKNFLFCFSLIGLLGFLDVIAQTTTPEPSEAISTTTENPWGSSIADQSEVQVASLPGGGTIQRQQAVNGTVTNTTGTTVVVVPAVVVTTTTTTAAPSGNGTTPKVGQCNWS
uniref:Uncharacterized protein n=1 Tax=Ditylenchus dipsaci TaxID=166011 RepID=A0A915DX42_9BILA